MGKQFLPILLLFALLLPGCAPADSSASTADFTAQQVLQAALSACPEAQADGGQLHTLSQEELAGYLPALYGLEAGQWTDAAVAVQDGMSVFELGVILLAEDTDGQAALESLDAYRVGRQGDFTGYAPDQAALAERGQALLLERYLILLICQDPDSAAAAAEALLSGESVPVFSPSDPPAAENTPQISASLESSEVPSSQSLPPNEASEAPADAGEAPTGIVEPSPAPSPVVSPAPSVPVHDPAAGRTPYTDPDIDDMTLYDTDPILSAWRSGDSSALGEKDAAILSAAEAVLQEATDHGMSAYETERAVYRWLVETVGYDWAHQSFFQTMDPDSSNPYGALVNHTAICLGYATTFQLLMDMAGVECITVVGAAFGSSEDHAWNMVRLNGSWYCVDATWDMGVPERYWSYFNVTSDWMAQTDHQWDYASVPEATATDGGRG